MNGEVLIRGYRLVGRTRTLTGRPWRRRRLLPFGAGLRLGGWTLLTLLSRLFTLLSRLPSLLQRLGSSLLLLLLLLASLLAVLLTSLLAPTRCPPHPILSVHNSCN